MSSHQPTPAPLEPLAQSDRHIVETPEQIDLQFDIAGIGSRFLALSIDTLIQFAAGIVLAVAVPLLIRFGLPRSLPQASLWLTAAVIVLSFLLYFGYFALFEIFWNGQTPGKRATRIRVIKETGRPLNPLEVVGRNLLRIVDQLPGFYGVGIIAAMLNPQSKRLGDFVAGSLVVRERTPAVWNSPVSNVAGAPRGVHSLTAEQAGLIEAFVARRDQLSPDVRRKMAGEIFKRIQPILPAISSPQTGAEELLLSLLHEYRS